MTEKKNDKKEEDKETKELGYSADTSTKTRNKKEDK